MKRTTVAMAAALTGLLGLTACGGGSDPMSNATSAAGSAASSAAGGDIVVGGADFSESILLAEIYAGALKAKGINATTRTNIGSREVYLKALEDGSIHVMPEYTGALAVYYDKGFTKTDPNEVYDGAKAALPAKFTLLAKSEAEDKDAIVVTKDTANKQGLTSIEDLKGKAGDMTLAAMPEFKTRVQGVPGLKSTYGVEFGQFRPIKGQAIVQALKNGQADAGNIFTTDPSITANNFVVLEDTKRLFGSQNIVPLVAKDKAAQVQPALDAVSAKLTTEKVTQMLQQTDIEKKDPKAVAQEFLTAEGLG